MYTLWNPLQCWLHFCESWTSDGPSTWKGGHFQPKERVKSSASTLPVPADAPDWAVMPQTQSLNPSGSPAGFWYQTAPALSWWGCNSDTSTEVSDWFKLGLQVIVFLIVLVVIVLVVIVCFWFLILLWMSLLWCPSLGPRIGNGLQK